MDKRQLSRTIIVFVTFLVSGLLMILLPHRMDLAQPETAAALKSSLPLIGSAMMAAGMVFFLLEMTRIERKKNI